MDRICQLAGSYRVVAVDTEFPGIVVRPVGNDPSATDRIYQTLRCNVDLLPVIQIGISLCDMDGEEPEGVSCWQFNFQFSPEQDIYAQDSIDLLSSSGVDFAEHERNGISLQDFGELITCSGLVLNDDIKWVSFHGGYDFAFIVKVLTASNLPSSEAEFFDLLRAYFPQLYDIKYVISSTEYQRDGLNKLADRFGCARVGSVHQAGSDSLLTLHVYARLLHEIFGGRMDDSLRGILHGLGAASGLKSDETVKRQIVAT